MEEKKFWTSEKFVSLSAMIISLCTLLLFVYELNITRRQQYASVLPYLQIRNVEMHYPTYKLSLINDGVGPAIVKSIKVIKDDIEYVGDPARFIVESGIFKNDTTLEFAMTNIYPGRLIPPGKQLDMISAMGGLDNAEKLSDIFLNKGTIIEVEYESVYGETWTLKGIGNAPVKR